MVDDKLTGKAGKVFLKGTSIPFTTAKPEINNNLKDATDSTNYNQTAKRLFGSKRPGRLEASIDVDFNFNPTRHQTQVLGECRTGTTPADCIIYADIDESIKLFEGKVWIGNVNFTIDAKEGEMLTGTATLESEDVFVTA